MKQQAFWLQQALASADQPVPVPLQGERQADVCIVGGGFTGLWTAIMTQLAQPQWRIVLLEKDLCGSGASGRNGGCMLTWSTKYLTLCRLYGAEEAGRLVAKRVARPERQLRLHYAWGGPGFTAPGRALQWWLQQLQSPATRKALLENHHHF